MVVSVKVQEINKKAKAEGKSQETKPAKAASPPAHGVIYSKRLNFCPFTTPPLEAYAPILGDERMERSVMVFPQQGNNEVAESCQHLWSSPN